MTKKVWVVTQKDADRPLIAREYFAPYMVFTSPESADAFSKSPYSPPDAQIIEGVLTWNLEA